MTLARLGGHSFQGETLPHVLARSCVPKGASGSRYAEDCWSLCSGGCDARGVFGKLQSPFDLRGDSRSREIGALCVSRTAREKPARIRSSLANQSALRQPIGGWGILRASVNTDAAPANSYRLGAALCVSRGTNEARQIMLKLRSIGLSDIPSSKAGSALAGSVGHRTTRLALERHSPPAGRIAYGLSPDINTAKSEFREAWKALKARTPPEQLAAAYRAMNIRGDD